ncbi:hypothetical protein IJ847_00025 [Candidatus Saccharibacteria bacterium]|nr:hypothetical protein [Candidatus Saccharibacteria bacterium]
MEKKNSFYKTFVVSLLVVLAFFAGRAFGQSETSKVYDELVDECFDTIRDLQDELQKYTQNEPDSKPNRTDAASA